MRRHNGFVRGANGRGREIRPTRLRRVADPRKRDKNQKAAIIDTIDLFWIRTPLDSCPSRG
jgi:hypothetical protein